MADTLIIYLPEYSFVLSDKEGDAGALKAGAKLDPALGETLNSSSGNSASDIDHVVEWALLDMTQKRIRVSGKDTLSSVLSVVREKYPESLIEKTIVLIPGTQVLLKEVVFPGKQTRHLTKAIPYMLEDSIASDVEQNFFAIGKAENNKVPVAIIENKLMDYWWDQLKKCGIKADLLSTDILMLPFEESVWTLLLGRSTAWLRSALSEGISINQTAFEPVLETLAENVELDFNTLSLTVIDTQALEESTFDEHISHLTLQGNDIPVNYRHADESVFETFCLNYLSSNKHSLINFCQGPYRRSSSGLKLNFNWKPLALLLFLLLAVEITGGIYQKIYYQSKADEFRQQSVKLYKQYFPQDKRIVNIKVQTRNHLQLLSGLDENKRFLPLLYEVGKTLENVQGDNKNSIRLTRIGFDSKLGDIQLDMIAKDFAILEKYKQKLIDNGLKVDIGSAVSGEQGVQARARIFPDSVGGAK